ncbi:hypothetical protein JKP88DRAFT_250259 [Tribonema minus]|uniref:Uncharacterized protein n=1 Tax=Tribonema minus TaxID=303371 RepID=A0A835YQJ3_9STRA|nr:hypothetical protein JKP88DRAFT_250259 [Tribonema minus]
MTAFRAAALTSARLCCSTRLVAWHHRRPLQQLPASTLQRFQDLSHSSNLQALQAPWPPWRLHGVFLYVAKDMATVAKMYIEVHFQRRRLAITYWALFQALRAHIMNDDDDPDTQVDVTVRPFTSKSGSTCLEPDPYGRDCQSSSPGITDRSGNLTGLGEPTSLQRLTGKQQLRANTTSPCNSSSTPQLETTERTPRRRRIGHCHRCMIGAAQRTLLSLAAASTVLLHGHTSQRHMDTLLPHSAPASSAWTPLHSHPHSSWRHPCAAVRSLAGGAHAPLYAHSSWRRPRAALAALRRAYSRASRTPQQAGRGAPLCRCQARPWWRTFASSLILPTAARLRAAAQHTRNCGAPFASSSTLPVAARLHVTAEHGRGGTPSCHHSYRWRRRAFVSLLSTRAPLQQWRAIHVIVHTAGGGKLRVIACTAGGGAPVVSLLCTAAMARYSLSRPAAVARLRVIARTAGGSAPFVSPLCTAAMGRYSCHRSSCQRRAFVSLLSSATVARLRVIAHNLGGGMPACRY